MLIRSESGLIEHDSRAYFNDLNELILQAADTVEIYYTLVNDHLGIYHTNVSNGVNSVMKVLTIFASIFIPLTFIAGVYGTNFPYIPEFGFRYSYFVMLGVMALVAVVMLIYFRRKKWL
ncbi:MAG: CorA family divalent cation transporter [Bacteroidales bacterium]